MDILPYVVTLLAILAGGWALYKSGSATGNAKAERAEDAKEAARVANQEVLKSMAQARRIQQDAAGDIARGDRPDGVQKFDL